MTTEPVPDATLREMMAYYRARADEYDEWFYRRGRYDRGAESNARWFVEVDHVFLAFDELAIGGDVLELAPGTGIWTERILRTAASVTAVDASPEMVAINQARVHDERVTYVLADLFTWRPDRIYDAVCFGFWLSHVPDERLDDFFQLGADALHPGGKVWFVDGRREPSSTAVNHQLPELGSQVMTRRLNDGRAFQIVKNFYDPRALAVRCAAAGLDVDVRETATFFLYGAGVSSQ
jgi:demethylmenaquinone methyltransferase/2-methoxy-6-polyprenyl-1,4-benzoquinol methylase